MRLNRNLRHWSIWAFIAAMVLWPHAAQADTITPERIAVALSKLEALAEAAVADGAVPGLAIGVVRDDEVIFLKGFGHREAGKPEAVDADTVFQIASLSKPVSATVVAALVSDGIVSWDSKIADLDPAFRLADPYPTSRTHGPRPVFAPQRASGHRRRRPRGHWLRPRRDPASPAVRAAIVELSRRLLLQQFRTDRGCRGGRQADRQALGGGRRGEALSSARHGLDQFPPFGLRQAHQPRRAPCQGRWRLGREDRSAIRMRRRPPAASVPRHVTSRNGCASSSATASMPARN